MKNPSWTTVGVAVVVAPLALALAGCGSSDGKDDGDSRADKQSASSVPADPKQALAASVQELTNGNFRFAGRDDSVVANGVVHKSSQSAEMSMQLTDDGVSMNLNYRVVGPDCWVKVTTPDADLAAAMKLPAGKWLHMQNSKLKDAEMAIDFGNATSFDPGDSVEIVKSVVTAQRTGDGKYTGTTDLSQLADGDLIDDDTVTALAAKAKELPFTAVLDAEGRLTSLTVQIPAAGDIKAHAVEMTYSDYGKAAAPQQPAAGEIVEATAEQYEFFNTD